VAVAERADLLMGRDVPLGRYTMVNRLLPHTNRRTVGAWCFFDHFGPEELGDGPGMQVPPHPHSGLQTVTWLLDGEVIHRDSLGNLARIRPGQLNLMTAGHGIAHAEESPAAATMSRPRSMHGLQLWIALPVDEAAGEARFEHYADLPRVEVDGAHATVAIGEYAGVASPARVHTPIVGVEIALPAGATASMPLREDFEYAVVAASGSAHVAGVDVAPGALLYLGAGRTSVPVAATLETRLFLIGGEPFEDELVMWWNFVARSHEEIVAAREDWVAGRRFGDVHGAASPRLPAPEMPMVRLKPRGRAGHGRD
jgi:redox-sensitive bicupin YhaK (pirin superfamily)